MESQHSRCRRRKRCTSIIIETRRSAVAMRAVTLSSGHNGHRTNGNGKGNGHAPAPIMIYDTSGPYTDSKCYGPIFARG